MEGSAEVKPVAIVHRTPGLLDLRSLTVMGLSAKPRAGGHPIGQFGTGLKYAVATLLRLGCGLTIFIGEQEYRFERTKGEFRGAEYTGLKFRPRRLNAATWGKTQDLPFTTEYGKYWQPWMAFRELHSNTLDEGGDTYPVYGDLDEVPRDQGPVGFLRQGDFAGLAEHTTIVVEGEPYVDAWLDRDSVFLPEGVRDAAAGGGETLQVLEGESEYLYYRGLRVLQLPKRSRWTYNLLGHIPLTEDRTLYGDFQAKDVLQGRVQVSADEEFIESVLTADESYWEHGQEVKSTGMVSSEFMAVVGRNQARVHPSAWGVWADRTPSRARKLTPWELAARPWSVEAEAGEQGRVLDAKGRVVFLEPVGEYGDNSLTWVELAKNMVATVNRHADRDLADNVMYAKRDALPEPVGRPVATAEGVSYRDLGDDIPF